MKNLAECKGGMASSSMMGSGSAVSEDTAAVGVWDLRDQLRLDAPWKHKTDILSDAFYEAVLQGLTSSFHVRSWFHSNKCKTKMKCSFENEIK